MLTPPSSMPRRWRFPVRSSATRSGASRTRGCSAAKRATSTTSAPPETAPRGVRAFVDGARTARRGSTPAMPSACRACSRGDARHARPRRPCRGSSCSRRRSTGLRSPTDVVRFVGDIVAAVVAETRAQAVDAAEAVVVDYDPLPVGGRRRGGARRRRAPAVPRARLEPGHRVRLRRRTRPIFDDADVVVEGRFVNQRLVAVVPMESNGVLVEPRTGRRARRDRAHAGPFGVRDRSPGRSASNPNTCG